MTRAKQTWHICPMAVKAVAIAWLYVIAMLMSGCNSHSPHDHSRQFLQGAPAEHTDSKGNHHEGKGTDTTDKLSYVDKPAAFPGGEEKLMEWIHANMKITPEMAESDVIGRVIINFIVKADGSIGEVEVVRSLHPDYDEEAVRVVKSLPKFTPATVNDKAVDYNYTLSIPFMLR